MLKIIILRITSCLILNFPVENTVYILVLIVLRYRINRYNYLNIILDNLSCNLLLLTFIIIIICLLTNSKLNQEVRYTLRIRLLSFFLIFSFLTKNFILFFILFESSLIPLFLLILGWGYQPERLQSSIYFLFYTLIGSLPLLITLLIFFNYNFLNWSTKNSQINIILYLGLILAFLVKMPMFLVHLWLPKAHVEAPTVGSMILAGVTLKLGSYALLRLFRITNYLSIYLNWIWISVRLIGRIILCIVCLRQIDLKLLIAYSSVVHMGLCLITTLFILRWSYEGGLWLSVSHGLASSGLFFLTNSLYLRFNRRSLFINKGLGFTLPIIRIWWFILLIFNMASPPSLNLFREIKMIVTTIRISNLIIIFSVISRFFCASYCLYLYRRVTHGKHSTSTKNSNRIIIVEHLNTFNHIWILVIALLLISFIQWITYLYSLIKIMICGIIVIYKLLIL